MVNNENVKPFRGSFSTCNMYHKCPRKFYYIKVLKLPQDGDFKYANAGNVVHNTLDNHYSGALTCGLNQAFNAEWKGKYKLPEVLDDKGRCRLLYQKMMLTALKLRLPITTTELRIEYPNFLYIIDVVCNINEQNKKVFLDDWKTSSCKNKWNEFEYELQMKCYAWGYYRKYGIIPEKCTVRYLNTGETIVIKPNIEMIKEIESLFQNILKEIEFKHDNGCGVGDYPYNIECEDNFCLFKERCAEDNKKMNSGERGNNNKDNWWDGE